ncbi:hypothetical protein PENTCL1PPCAC_18758, partial [Pristionchus entomophagus]
DFKTLAQGFIVLMVYGIASIINFLLSRYYSTMRAIPGAAMQFLLFFYISIDVITVALIPLSIFLTVSTLRAAPLETLASFRKRARRRVLARKAVTKWRAHPVIPTARLQTVPVSSE